jgi:hypothetical protein
VQLTFDVRQDVKQFLAVGGVSLALVMGTTAGAMAAPMDADRDGLSRGQEVRITETNPNDADSNNDGVRDGNEDKDRDGVDNTDDRALFGAAAMDDDDVDNDEIEDGDEDEDSDDIDNEDEDDDDEDEDEEEGEDD